MENSKDPNKYYKFKLDLADMKAQGREKGFRHLGIYDISSVCVIQSSA